MKLEDTVLEKGVGKQKSAVCKNKKKREMKTPFQSVAHLIPDAQRRAIDFFPLARAGISR